MSLLNSVPPAATPTSSGAAERSAGSPESAEPDARVSGNRSGLRGGFRKRKGAARARRLQRAGTERRPGGVADHGTAMECTWVGWAGTAFNTGEARRRPSRSISCRTMFGTGRGADDDGPDLTGGEQLRAAASTCRTVPSETASTFSRLFQFSFSLQPRLFFPCYSPVIFTLSNHHQSPGSKEYQSFRSMSNRRSICFGPVIRLIPGFSAVFQAYKN